MNSNDDRERNQELPATFAPNGLSLNDERGGEIYKAEPATASEAVARRGFQFRTFLCPICHAKISISRDQAGKKVACPDCETVVTAPTNLDFDSETEYERANFDKEKRRRDELFSPIRNPKREGIKIDANEVYGLDVEGDNQSDAAESAPGENSVVRRGFQFRSFLCPTCQTKISITRAQAGRRVVCPDCGMIVEAPTNLNFDAETQYERDNFDQEKKRRDELLSPIRNPKREGIGVDSKSVYGLDSGQGASETSRVRKERVKYVPVQCRICETFIQVPESQIGTTIKCPDCGSPIEVTAVLKNQKDVIDVKFAPRDRGTYDIGAIPEQRGAVIRMPDGSVMELDPKEKFVDSSGALSKAFERAKKARERGESPSPEVGAPAQVPPRQSVASATKASKSRKSEKKPPRPKEEIDWSAPKVLRKKDGQLVWAVPSPPRPFPLFNRTFVVALGFGFWKRVLILELMLAVCFLTIVGCGLIARESFGGFFLVLALLVVLPIFLATLAPHWALYFQALCDAGAAGQRRISEWSEEFSFMDGLLTALYYGVVWTVASFVLPTITLCCQSAFSLDMELFEKGYTVLSRASACVFFPIFVLSSRLSGNWFMILHRDVLWTTITKFHLWLQLFLATALLFYALPALWNFGFGAKSPLILLAAFLAVPLTGLYALLLGRMAWIIEDSYRLEEYDDE